MIQCISNVFSNFFQLRGLSGAHGKTKVLVQNLVEVVPSFESAVDGVVMVQLIVKEVMLKENKYLATLNSVQVHIYDIKMAKVSYISKF